MAAERIRIRLKAYDNRLIDRSVKLIVDTVRRTSARLAGPIPLPTKRRIYTVLRSPHVDKKSREQFEMRIHKRLIDVHNPTDRTIEEFNRLELPPGVDIEIKF